MRFFIQAFVALISLQECKNDIFRPIGKYYPDLDTFLVFIDLNKI